VPLPVERNCLVVPLRATQRYLDMVVLLQADDFRDSVGYSLGAAQQHLDMRSGFCAPLLADHPLVVLS
jgi:hypothetical protein